MLEFIGWIGSICFAICGIPQAWKSYVDKHSNGISNYFILLWFLGEILTLIYIVFQEQVMLPLIFNYIINLVSLLVIMYYKYCHNSLIGKIALS